MAAAINLQPNASTRAWEYWVMPLEKSGGMPPR